MKTQETFLTRGRQVYDGVNIPQREFEERLADVQGRMNEADVDVLLVYSHGDRDGHVAYLANLGNRVSAFPDGLVITPQDIALVTQRSSRGRPNLESATWVTDLRFIRDIAEEMIDQVETIADPGDTIGLAGGVEMAYSRREKLDAGLADYDLEPFDVPLWEARYRKSHRELDQIRRATRVLAECEEVLQERIEAPILEYRLMAELDRMARLHGAEDVRFLLSNPGATEPQLRPAEDAEIVPGQSISVYMAVRYEGYWAESTRAVRLVDDGPAETHEDVTALCDDLVASIEPGQSVDAIETMATDLIEDSAYERDSHVPIANGIGLELDESPAPERLGTDRDIAEHTSLAVRIPVRTADGDVLCHGETVLVMPDGVDVPTR